MSIRNFIQSLTHADTSERGLNLVNAEILNGTVTEGGGIDVRFTYTDEHPVTTRNAFAIRSSDLHGCFGEAVRAGEMGPGDSIEFNVDFRANIPGDSISGIAGWNIPQNQPLEGCELGRFGFNYIDINYLEVLAESLPSRMEVTSCNVGYAPSRTSIQYDFTVSNPLGDPVEVQPEIQINNLTLSYQPKIAPSGGTARFSGESPLVSSQFQDMGGEGTHPVEVVIRRATRQ